MDHSMVAVPYVKAVLRAGATPVILPVVDPTDVNRMLDGIRTWFGLPYAATALLEADREALGLDRHDYLLHVLFQRSLELREKGAGFDAPGGERKKR